MSVNPDVNCQQEAPPELFLPRWPIGTPGELIAETDIFAGKILAKHGIKAFAMPFEAAVAHESGHVIVAAAEGCKIDKVCLIRSMLPALGEIWGGKFLERNRWTRDANTPPQDDLRRARIVIAGYAGEKAYGVARPGSSLDERALSYFLAVLAADNLKRTDWQALWHEQVWKPIKPVFETNRRPFEQLMDALCSHERVQGAKLQTILSHVKPIATKPSTEDVLS